MKIKHIDHTTHSKDVVNYMNFLTRSIISVGSLGVGFIATRLGAFGHNKINIDIDKYDARIYLVSSILVDSVRVRLRYKDPPPSVDDGSLYTRWSIRPMKVLSVGRNHMVDETEFSYMTGGHTIHYVTTSDTDTVPAPRSRFPLEHFIARSDKEV